MPSATSAAVDWKPNPVVIGTGGESAAAAYRRGMARSTGLGEYLRARRALVRPEDVGLQAAGRRRVPGLRREELATLAGISSDYYLRLEQGRDQHPSPQVIDAVARALQLDEDAAAHLHVLAQPDAAARRSGQAEHASASIEQLIASWPNTPAFVQNRHMDILAANSLASALSPVLSAGVNLVRATFLDPEVRRLTGDWDSVAYSAVSRLRALAGPDIDDPRLAELVGELSVRSDWFRRLWARHDIEVAAVPVRTFHHPLVGSLELYTEWLAITGAEGQLLVVYHAAPGSPSEQALTRLAGMVAAGDRARA
jgi:transcriptional regulator with XRE-family HTH domain